MQCQNNYDSHKLTRNMHDMLHFGGSHDSDTTIGRIKYCWVESSWVFHQFIIDMFAKIETERPHFIGFNQTKLRAEEYIHLKDVIRDDKDTSEIGKVIILPS